ncbi:glycyl-radical enzyme activating protein [[Clostridium] symbiosum]|uniref:glycyl-radical enzyme activating protein n=1 Tax=Clostridium symbiosum TaxID=1512 RepID=UPI001D0785F2|nr:glycyl-radical enzyme activating protein [[Clostridium] symbiosum]MCB6607288.1 glycyl-radical enzyme activating protein [[Clostridium] symbiosum]MCB6929848.1 glycyl-radical enzyme activating protein [[Clostridium] symbiosum]
MSISGKIFDIQRYSLHDGPGIRTLIFMKGCPLRCRWCCNPEGLQHQDDILYDLTRCIGCGKCLDVCQFDAVHLSQEEGFTIDRAKCTHCGECAKACPSGAKTVAGREITVQEALDIVRRDKPFYKSSNGGVTLGGGEILEQPEFVYEVLKACKEDGINTAIETSGYGQWAHLERILTVTDTAFVDLKTVNPALHLTTTGVSNTRILENLQKVNDFMGKEENRKKVFTVRIPVIPGMNDTTKDAMEAGCFLKKLQNCTGVEVLPFHNYGEIKYKKLGMNYEFADYPNSTVEMLITYQHVLKESGRDVVVKKM